MRFYLRTNIISPTARSHGPTCGHWPPPRGQQCPRFAERDLWNIEPRLDALKFDIRRPDHLAPFFVFTREKSSELGGRTCNDGLAPIGNGLLNLGIGEARVDRLVEQVDDPHG